MSKNYSQVINRRGTFDEFAEMRRQKRADGTLLRKKESGNDTTDIDEELAEMEEELGFAVGEHGEVKYPSDGKFHRQRKFVSPYNGNEVGVNSDKEGEELVRQGVLIEV